MSVSTQSFQTEIVAVDLPNNFVWRPDVGVSKSPRPHLEILNLKLFKNLLTTTINRPLVWNSGWRSVPSQDLVDHETWIYRRCQQSTSIFKTEIVTRLKILSFKIEKSTEKKKKKSSRSMNNPNSTVMKIRKNFQKVSCFSFE